MMMMMMMKCRLPWVVICISLLLLPLSVQCKEDPEKSLLEGLNSHRTSLKLAAFNKNKEAECLAEELADERKDKPCVAPSATTVVEAAKVESKLIKECKINPNTIADGVILPVCVKKLAPTLLLTNYTMTDYVRFVNDSKFTGAGLGSKDDWMVLVLATNTTGGSFAASAAYLLAVSYYHFVSLFVAFFLL